MRCTRSLDSRPTAPDERPMSSLVFDSHAFVKRLTSVGMPEEQSRLIDGRLATKVDIEQLRAATKSDIAQLQAATKADIEQLREDTKKDLAVLEASLKAIL